MLIAAVLTLALLLSACSGAGGDAAAGGAGAAEGGVVLADSAGIPVVVNPAEPPGGALWQLSQTPVLQIGETDGAPEDLLLSVFDGFVLSDGRIALANTGTFEVRIYDADGRHLSSVGREGDGPGEFRRLRLAGPIAGDSLIAFDALRRRVTVLAPDGTIARSYPLADEVFGELGFPLILGALENGGLVLRAGERPSEESGIVRDPNTVGVLSADGARWTPLGTFPGSERSVVRSEGGFAGTDIPYGRELMQAAAGSRIVVATNDAFSLRIYHVDGRLLRIVRQDRSPRRAGPEYFDLYVQRGRERLARQSGPSRERMELAIEQIPRYETLPAFSQLRLDRTGHLWVQEYVQIGEPRTDWQVFDPEGVLVARVRLPEGLEIRDVGADYLLGVHRDELGVERVRLYELTRGADG